MIGRVEVQVSIALLRHSRQQLLEAIAQSSAPEAERHRLQDTTNNLGRKLEDLAQLVRDVAIDNRD